MAAAHVLHYGVPVRKVCAQGLTGVEVSQGAMPGRAAACHGCHHKLRTSVGVSRLVHTDDTGWRVGGEPAFLMAFETLRYMVRARHRTKRCARWFRRRRGDGDGSGAKLRCSGSVRGEATEVPGPRAALDQRGGPDQDRERTQLRQASEGSSQRWNCGGHGERRQAVEARDRPMADADNYRLHRLARRPGQPAAFSGRSESDQQPC